MPCSFQMLMYNQQMEQKVFSLENKKRQSICRRYNYNREFSYYSKCRFGTTLTTQLYEKEVTSRNESSLKSARKFSCFYICMYVYTMCLGFFYKKHHK